MPNNRTRAAWHRCRPAVPGCTQALKLTKDDSPVVLSHQLISRAEPRREGIVHGQDALLRQRHRQAPRRVSRFGHDQDEDGRRLAVRDRSSPTTPRPARRIGGSTQQGADQRARLVSGRATAPSRSCSSCTATTTRSTTPIPGYGYLGELLASRGFILVSVDENFINGNLRGESDGRAWLLLKHLEDWKRWNDSSAGPFSHKVDMHNIAIMGHSRGGEAVGIAAAFNRLSHYPDDANVKFNFNFDIKSVFAIAPVDGQYKPAGAVHADRERELHGDPRLARRRRLVVQRTAGLPAHPVHRRQAVVQGGMVRLPRQSRPVEHRVGKQGQRAAQRALPRPARPDHARRAAAVQQGGDRRIPRGDAARQARVPADVPRPSRRSARGCPKTMYITRFQESGLQAAGDVRRGRGRDDRLRAGGYPCGRQSCNVEGERAQSAQRAERSDQHKRGDARLEQPHPRRRHDEARQAGVVHDLADRLARRQSATSGANRAVYLSLAPTDAKPGPRAPARDTTKKADSTKKDEKKAPPEEARSRRRARTRRRSISPSS